MKKFVILILFIALYSCNTPKQRTNKALKLAIKGEYTKNVTDYFFEHKELFTSEPYVERYINEYKANARSKADDAANVLINIPNLIDDFEFVKMEKKEPKDLISLMPLEIMDGVWLSNIEKEYYVKEKEGIIDYKNKMVTFTEEKNVEMATLYYIITKNDKKERFKIETIKLGGEWKIYYCMPEDLSKYY